MGKEHRLVFGTLTGSPEHAVVPVQLSRERQPSHPRVHAMFQVPSGESP